MEQDPNKIRMEARALLMKARLYRYIAVVFALVGLAIFLAIYLSHVEGRLLEALSNPLILASFLIPFLPALLLSWLSGRTEKKFYAFLEAHRKK
ncbi:MAG: hypothetical protein H6868_05475 [Rhodospirillales bacterium]|nr:hypothetical protein [Rhodospirillales bacterium]